MNAYRALSAGLLLTLPFAAFATDPASTAPAIAQKLLPEITAWRRDLHEHPELSNREVRTSKFVAAELKKLGYEVRTGIAHTGVTGVLKGGKPGPRLAIRADMDALPVTEEVDLPFASKVKGEYIGKTVGVMHACGHDAHTAMTLGVAEALAKMKDALHGEVMFVFQPAEEGSPPGEEGGAPLMVKDGVFKDFKPDAVFGMHVVSALNVGDGRGAARWRDGELRHVPHRRAWHAEPWRDAVERHRSDRDRGRDRHERADHRQPRARHQLESGRRHVRRLRRRPNASTSCRTRPSCYGTVRAFDENDAPAGADEPHQHRRHTSRPRMARRSISIFRSRAPIRTTAIRSTTTIRR